MAKPFNDRLKVKIDSDVFNLDSDKSLHETGVVVEVPEEIIYLGFHSFAFEHSIADEDKLKRILEFYKDLLGKRIWWEKLQDSGRHLKEDDGEYVFLNMTDVIAYSDDVEEQSELLSSNSAAGSFNLE